MSNTEKTLSKSADRNDTMMKRIAIIGSGGAGKSTLARQLGERLGLKVYHLDALLWKPNWVGVPREEQIKIQEELVRKPDWIIDGNYGGTMDIRMEAAETIIFLDYSKYLCVYRAFKRMIQYRKQTRPDMGEGCEERLDFKFLKWIWDYPKSKRPDILAKLNTVSNEKNIIILKSPKETRLFLAELDAQTRL